MQTPETQEKGTGPHPSPRRRRPRALRRFTHIVSELGLTYQDLKTGTIEPKHSNARVYVLTALCDAIALAEADSRLSELEKAVADARAAVARGQA